MALSNLLPDQELAQSVPAYIKLQHIFFAACIALGPLTFLFYALLGVGGNGGHAIIAGTMAANPTAIQLHLAFGVVASFLLPFGYLGMALLVIRRLPWLGTISVLLSIPGWAPLSALICLDSLTYDMAQMGGAAPLPALWDCNGLLKKQMW